MNSADQLVQQSFRDYYMGLKFPVFMPEDPARREYGFLLFKEKFMVRHRTFKAPEAVLQAIRDLTPRHVYYSTAYYSDPTAAMDQKGWAGADLVFDIDADHLDTPCKKEHDTWKCKQCGKQGTGTTPKLCPECKSERMDEETWLCEQCLRQAKEETHNLLESLFSDIGTGIGLEPGNVRVFFSGHRGYHIHIVSKELSVLQEEGRREIVDYVLGTGFMPEVHLNVRQVSSRTNANIVGSAKIIEGPSAEEPGWRKKIVMGIYEDKDALRDAEKDKFLEKPRWSLLGVDKSKSLATAAVNKLSAEIDTVVTTDVHRLIRLPETLNGHTGFLAARVPIEQLDEFDPFVDAVAFNNGKTMKVYVKDAPAFKLGGMNLGPFHNEMVEIPKAAAILLLCKHRADPNPPNKTS